MKKFNTFVKRFIVPLSGIAMALCMFVANSSPYLCLGIWGYEEEMPNSLQQQC